MKEKWIEQANELVKYYGKDIKALKAAIAEASKPCKELDGKIDEYAVDYAIASFLENHDLNLHKGH